VDAGRFHLDVVALLQPVLHARAQLSPRSLALLAPAPREVVEVDVMPIWLARLLALFVGLFAPTVLIVFAFWLCALLAAIAHGGRRLVRRGRSELRTRSDRVSEAWRRRNLERDGSHLSAHPAAEKRLKAQLHGKDDER
jgi:hypothetical protein